METKAQRAILACTGLLTINMWWYVLCLTLASPVPGFNVGSFFGVDFKSGSYASLEDEVTAYARKRPPSQPLKVVVVRAGDTWLVGYKKLWVWWSAYFELARYCPRINADLLFAYLHLYPCYHFGWLDSAEREHWVIYHEQWVVCQELAERPGIAAVSLNEAVIVRRVQVTASVKRHVGAISIKEDTADTANIRQESIPVNV